MIFPNTQKGNCYARLVKEDIYNYGFATFALKASLKKRFCLFILKMGSFKDVYEFKKRFSKVV